jgi:hypothetical protein
MIFSIIADPGGAMVDINLRLLPGVTVKDEEVRLGMIAATRVYTRWIRERYLSASRGDGTWAPLALMGRVYNLNPMGRRFSRMHVRRGILIKTGDLFDSMFEGGGGHTEQVVGSSVRVGTMVPYAQFHQFGTSRMPARTIFVPPDAGTLQEMTRLIKQGIQRAREQYLVNQGWDQEYAEEGAAVE